MKLPTLGVALLATAALVNADGDCGSFSEFLTTTNATEGVNLNSIECNSSDPAQFSQGASCEVKECEDEFVLGDMKAENRLYTCTDDGEKGVYTWTKPSEDFVPCERGCKPFTTFLNANAKSGVSGVDEDSIDCVGGGAGAGAANEKARVGTSCNVTQCAASFWRDDDVAAQKYTCAVVDGEVFEWKTDAVTDKDFVPCRPGYKYTASEVGTYSSFGDAERACNHSGGNLASIHSDAEREMVYKSFEKWTDLPLEVNVSGKPSTFESTPDLAIQGLDENGHYEPGLGEHVIYNSSTHDNHNHLTFIRNIPKTNFKKNGCLFRRVGIYDLNTQWHLWGSLTPCIGSEKKSPGGWASMTLTHYRPEFWIGLRIINESTRAWLDKSDTGDYFNAELSDLKLAESSRERGVLLNRLDRGSVSVSSLDPRPYVCKKDIDECEVEDACQNNGKCENQFGTGYSCKCDDTGFTGKRCETVVNEFCKVQGSKELEPSDPSLPLGGNTTFRPKLGYKFVNADDADKVFTCKSKVDTNVDENGVFDHENNAARPSVQKIDDYCPSFEVGSANVTYAGWALGDKATITCNEGHDIEESPTMTVTCGEDQLWSAAPSACTPKSGYCSVTAKDNTTPTKFSLKLGESTTVTSNAGYQFTDGSTAEITYTCSEGGGDNGNLRDKDGNIIVDLLGAKQIADYCPKFDVGNATVTYTGRALKEKATITCNGGYVMEGSTTMTVTCAEGPSWAAAPSASAFPSECTLIEASEEADAVDEDDEEEDDEEDDDNIGSGEDEDEDDEDAVDAPVIGVKNNAAAAAASNGNNTANPGQVGAGQTLTVSLNIAALVALVATLLA